MKMKESPTLGWRTLYRCATPTVEDEILSDWLAQNKEFASRDLENYLNKSKGTVRKIVEELLQSGQIVRIGNGPKTRYRVVKTTE